MSQKRQAEELEGEKPSEAKLNQGKGKDPTLNKGKIQTTPEQSAVSFNIPDMSPIKLVGSDTSSEKSENNIIMTSAASDITYVFKITGNGDEKKVTLKTIEVNPISNVKPLLKTEQTLELGDSEDSGEFQTASELSDGEMEAMTELNLVDSTAGGSKHRRTRKKRKKKKKSRKKR